MTEVEREKMISDAWGKASELADSALAQLTAVKTWAMDPLATPEELLKILEQEPAKSLAVDRTKTGGW